MGKKISFLTAIVLIFFFYSGCSDDSSKGNTSPAPGAYTYSLTGDGSAFSVWTAPVTYIVSDSDVAPSSSGSTVYICAAANEYEPFQLVLNGTGSVSVTFEGFTGISDSKALLYKAGFSGSMAESLTTISSGDEVNLTASSPTVLWFDNYIPSGASAGDYSATVVLTSSSETVEIPVSLTVFDFELPEEIHYKSHMTVGMSSLKLDGDSGDCEATKTNLYSHRFVVKGGPTWPTGFKYNITWPSGSFTDEPGEGVYGIGYNAAKYLKGDGWSKPGFPICQAFQFVNNSTPRPTTFNGVSIGSDQYGTSAYNAQWTSFLSDLNSYIANNGYSDKLYYYVINEPQNQADYDLAAYLCKLTKSAAPELKIAVSEEPKAEIAEHASYSTADGSSYDIWIADVQHYDQDYAWDRQKNYGEEVWFYHNDGTADPFINPIDFSKQGLHQRLIPWVSWHYRVTGWAYYNCGIFFSGKEVNIRGKLLREGFEDYEYLYLANGNASPGVENSCAVDEAVDSAAGSLTSYASDHDAFMDLKWELGCYIDGTLDDVPTYTVESSRERGSYYINFQNTGGNPSADPLTVDGNEYMKIGWSEYNDDDGYRWSGGCVGISSRALYCYDNASGYNELQKSCLYDDYGKVNLFEFDLESGTYSVTVGVGRAGKGCYDKHNVTVEGVTFFADYESSDVAEVTKSVSLTDGKLSLTMGVAGTGQYTFLSYMKIKPE